MQTSSSTNPAILGRGKKLAGQFETNEGQQRFAHSTANINSLAQSCGDTQDQHIQEGTWQTHIQGVRKYQMKQARTQAPISLIQQLWIRMEY